MPARPLRCLASRFRRGCARQCYYIGVGDKESGTAGGVKRDISSSFARGINAKRLCTRLKKKDAQMCELRYEKKVDVKNTDLKKLRVKELRKIADDEGIDVKGLVEKDEFIKKIHAHFGIDVKGLVEKDE